MADFCERIRIEKAFDAGVPTILAFLFPHQRSAHGNIEDFLVTVNVIESLTGADFFNALDDQTEKWLEDQDTWEVWKRQFISDE